jgi:hypothetical protein
MTPPAVHSPCRELQGEYQKLGHNNLFPYPFIFTTFLSFDGIPSQLLTVKFNKSKLNE